MVVVTPPPTPVMVMVEVPAGALLATLISMATLPEPPAMEEPGLKSTPTPAGSPEAVRLIVVSKPPEGVAVISAMAEPPGAMPPTVGAAANVKLPTGTGASALIRLFPLGLPQPVDKS